MHNSINSIIKKILLPISVTIPAMLIFATSYASITVDPDSQKMLERTTEWKGIIASAIYFPQRKMIQVTVFYNLKSIKLNFTDSEITIGTAFLNALHKEMKISFSDTNFTIASVELAPPNTILQPEKSIPRYYDSPYI